MKVAIIGGTGFVGGYLVDALLEKGHEPSLLVRPGSEAKARRSAECRLIAGELRSAAALEEVLEGCDAVIYNVGILREFPAKGITFQETQYEGVVRTLDAARKTGVQRFLLMSANGVKSPGTPYQETKYRAERAVEASGLQYTVFAPSVIFGDPRGAMEFATQLYRDMVRPPLPAVAFHTGCTPATGQVLMSPVHVTDVALAFATALEQPDSIGQRYVLGGPEVLSWARMVESIAAAAGKRKLILPMPVGLMRIGATLFDRLPFFPVTRDQLTMLAEGNTATANELRELIGREPLAFSPDNLGYLADSAETH